ncbi:MAG: pyridoxamine kinase [Oscillospiraceae bacterium]|jgi:pyridoxine kinase|nr:pyridoxamine kinase [Oscillospiraceae bacterium]
MAKQKRVAAIHDVSCFGKCSLTVALPVISAAGIEVSCIPTAILSTHTGGFTGYTYRDLTDDMLPIVSHWRDLSLRFDALYTGYLGSPEQLNVVSEIFDVLGGGGALVVVDPVMADNGSMYPSFPPDFPSGMRRLCSKADVVVPNMTEALMLLDEPYTDGPYTAEFIDGVTARLLDLGPRRVVLTGAHFDTEHLGAAIRETGAAGAEYIMSRRIPGSYHGTGDVFASALTAGLVGGLSLKKAARVAVDFTVGSIERTRAAGTDSRFGVNFESGLAEFIVAVLAG